MGLSWLPCAGQFEQRVWHELHITRTGQLGFCDFRNQRYEEHHVPLTDTLKDPQIQIRPISCWEGMPLVGWSLGAEIRGVLPGSPRLWKVGIQTTDRVEKRLGFINLLPNLHFPNERFCSGQEFGIDFGSYGNKQTVSKAPLLSPFDSLIDILDA